MIRNTVKKSDMFAGSGVYVSPLENLLDDFQYDNEHGASGAYPDLEEYITGFDSTKLCGKMKV